MTGIPDWNQKKEICRIVLQFPRELDVAMFVYDSRPHLPFTKEALQEHFTSRWLKRSVPDKSRFLIFFQILSNILECDEVTPGHNLVNASVENFVGTLPSKYIELLDAAFSQGEAKQGRMSDEEFEVLVEIVHKAHTQEVECEDDHHTKQPLKKGDWHPIWRRANEPKKTIQECFHTGRIDQSHFYQQYESAKLWFDITDAELYEGFDECETSLKRLTKSSVWDKMVDKAAINSMFMLGGGGSPSKDMIIINSILRNKSLKKKINHILVDTSSHMLYSSMGHIDRRMNSEPEIQNLSSKVEVLYVETDFLNSEYLVKFNESGNAIWFITGGTLGNLDEAAFFNAVSAMAKKGDYLVVGAHCTGSLTEESFKSFCGKLKDEYNDSSVKRLIKAPLAAIWSTLSVPEIGLDKVMASWEVNIDPPELSSPAAESKVPHSITPYATIEVGNIGKIALFKSSRYKREALIEFAENYGWQHLQNFEGLTPLYQQFVFEFV